MFFEGSMNLTSILKLDARLSDQLRVAEKPGALRNIAIFFAHSGDSVVLGRSADCFVVARKFFLEAMGDC